MMTSRLEVNGIWNLLLSPTVYAAEGPTDNSAARVDALEVLLHVQSNSSNDKMMTVKNRMQEVSETQRTAMEK